MTADDTTFNDIIKAMWGSIFIGMNRGCFNGNNDKGKDKDKDKQRLPRRNIAALLHKRGFTATTKTKWIPAFAGMTTYKPILLIDVFVFAIRFCR
jgi:hypothetical protein